MILLYLAANQLFQYTHTCFIFWNYEAEDLHRVYGGMWHQRVNIFGGTCVLLGNRRLKNYS